MTSTAPITDMRDPSQRSRKGHERKSKTKFIWIPILILFLLLIAGVAVGAMLLPKALIAKENLEKAMPLATQVKEQVIVGDTEGADVTLAQLSKLTAEAREETDSGLWKAVEWLPVVGDNLKAVRIASLSVDTLVTEVVTPASTLNVDMLKPVDGAFNIEGLQEAQTALKDAGASLQQINVDLESINRDALIDQVAGGVNKLDSAVGEINDIVEPLTLVMDVLPTVLGADEPRNYLVLFQNNAESRGTGGNPAALVQLTADNGRISITEQASSSDFNNGQPEMITDVDAETVALYGDKIGRWMQDVTLTPDFTETADIMEAFWADSFGTPIDGVASFDPVALSYLLEASGPVELPTGETMTADNAVDLLLNEVYSMYPLNEMQDAFFASAASEAFDAVTSGETDTKALLTGITRAVDEGRLMYVPSTDAEEALIAGTRVTGTLPVENTEETVLGVYINDITEGKLNYYTDLDVSGQSDQCTAEEPSFTATATFTNTLDPGEVPGLARYISPGRFFPKGVVSTDFVFYGPVGSSFVSATVDGEEVQAKSLPHLGRPAVKINVENPPTTSSVISATFTGGDGDFGPLEVRHTPMVRDTEVTIDTPGCG